MFGRKISRMQMHSCEQSKTGDGLSAEDKKTKKNNIKCVKNILKLKDAIQIVSTYAVTTNLHDK